ncbi:MAG TPA: cytochrome P450 [Bacteroidia bacterium]|nr:cytochrome P450 [Bacteroidia bacterium]
MKLPPGPRGHFVAGNLRDLRLRVLDFISGLRNEYGDVVIIRFAFRKVFYVQHPDLIRHVLQENYRNYTKSLRYEQFKYLLGNGLLTSEGDFWLRQRRLIQPAFHKDRLRALGEDMINCTEDMIRRWEAAGNSIKLNVAGEMMFLTLQIVAKTLLSANVGASTAIVGRSLSYLLHSVNRRTRTPILLPIWIPTPGHIRIKKAVKAINEVLEQVFSEHLQPRKGRYDLLDMLMETRYEDTGEPMSRQQLRDEVMTLFVAGHETTANALSWTLYLLSQHEPVRIKCVEEITAVCDHRPVASEQMHQLRYLTAVIEESMRLYPPAWMVGRRAINTDRLGDWEIPAGFNLLISPYAIHRDARYWPNPDKFQPERFLNEAAERPRYAYMPFGGGPRMCIGNNFAMMEMTLVLATLLCKYKPLYHENTPPVAEPLITLRPRGELNLTMERIVN